RRLFIAAPVQTELGAKLSVAIGVDPALAFAVTDRALRQELWMLIFVTLSTLLVAWFGGEAFVVRPLRALEDLARRLAAGEFSARARVANGVLGLQEMGSAVNEMAAALETREHALRASEDRYRHLFDENPHPMWVYELSTLKFIEVNDAALRHYGYTREEF